MIVHSRHPSDPAIAARLHTRLAALAEISEEIGKLTRGFLSPAMQEATRVVASWCRDSGLDAQVDEVGNLRARWRPRKDSPAQPVLVLGSHLDTVRNAGRYDGALGVVAALACVEQLQAWEIHPLFDLEVVAFADEEGLRFQTAYLGSSYYVGAFQEDWLELKDAEGTNLGDVLKGVGQDPRAVVERQSAAKNLCGYLELHVEQGPVLESEACSAGIVSDISAQTRAAIIFAGKANHAGTTPMELRQDALCAAAEGILLLEETAKRVPQLLATVGQLRLEPGASNVIPSLVRMSADLRHPEEALLALTLKDLQACFQKRAKQRGVSVEWKILQQGSGLRMDPELSAHLFRSAERIQGKAPFLVSGAGHDGVMMARLCPVAMLFVRCREGLSHHPDEYATPADIDTALAIFTEAVVSFAASFSPWIPPSTY